MSCRSLKAPVKVALLVETSNAYARGLLRGIVSYIREHRLWSLYLSEHNRGDKPPRWLAHWKGHGINARVENVAIAEALRPVSVPVVDVSAARLIPSLPWFETDDGAIAHLAADHLLERGFNYFAYAGDGQFNWSKWRCEHFQNCIRAAGKECFIYQPGKGSALDDEEQLQHLGSWIKELPKPVGVMACYDFRGHQVLDACRRIGVAVPDEVAVIGVDNDDLLCELSWRVVEATRFRAFERRHSGWRQSADAGRPLGMAQISTDGHSDQSKFCSRRSRVLVVNETA